MSDIRLVMEPGVVKGWDAFCRDAPPFSIAIDGYVNDGPKFDPGGPRQNFNHHEGVSRLETRCTASQFRMAMRMGLCDTFSDAHGARMVVYADDCDHDVATTVFQARHPHLVKQAINPALNRLVDGVDMLDTTVGSYPFPEDTPLLGEMAWIFEPYTEFRFSGQIDRMAASEYVRVVDDVCARLMQYVAGRGKTSQLDLRYERVGGGTGWSMVREIGAQARTRMFGDGIRAFVSVRETQTGSLVVTVARASAYTRFPLPAIMRRFNEAETSELRGCWGGGDTVFGNHRVRKTTLTPETMEAIIEEEIAALKAR